jgi:superfamily II DNA or RNA helicase
MVLMAASLPPKKIWFHFQSVVTQSATAAMNRSEAESLLRQMLGPAAQFRDGQWEAIDAVANRRERLLVVQRTGWGKSIVYFLATKILRSAQATSSGLRTPRPGLRMTCV